MMIVGQDMSFLRVQVSADNAFLASGAASLHKPYVKHQQVWSHKILAWMQIPKSSPAWLHVACAATCDSLWSGSLGMALGIDWLSVWAPLNLYQTFLHIGKTTGDFTIRPWPMALHGCTNFQPIASSQTLDSRSLRKCLPRHLAAMRTGSKSNSHTPMAPPFQRPGNFCQDKEVCYKTAAVERRSEQHTKPAG